MAGSAFRYLGCCIALGAVVGGRRLGVGGRWGRCRVLGRVGDPLLAGRGCGCRVGLSRRGGHCRLGFGEGVSFSLKRRR